MRATVLCVLACAGGLALLTGIGCGGGGTRTVTETTPAPSTESAADQAARQAAARAAAAREAARERAREVARRAREAARARARARVAARRAALARQAQRGITYSGSGSSVVSYRVRRDDPVVIKASNTGEFNFTVELVSPTGESRLAINEIGPGSWSGLTQAAPGRYKVKIEGEGSWRLNISQPLPASGAKRLPGRLSGSGSAVIPVQVARELPAATVTSSNSGESNFTVEIYGYGGVTTGSDLIVNEIGPGRWSTVASLPRGPFLMKVEGEGAWTVRVTP